MEFIKRLDHWDQQLMVLLNYDGTPWTDSFWFEFTHFWTWLAAAAAILTVIVLRYRHHWRKLLLVIVAIALIVTLCDQISSGLIKPLVMRPRPSRQPLIEHLLYYVNDYRGGRYGFVSSHAANSFGLCTFLFLLFHGVFFRATILGWTVATCYSRIYLGVHYPGDILGGTLIGIAVGTGIYYFFRYLSRLRPFARYENETSREEDIGYSREPWMISFAIWLTVVFVAVAAL